MQDKLEIPAKVPDYIFSFPGNYEGTNMGIPLHKDELRGVAELSRVMDGDVFDFITPRVRRECLQLLSNPEKVESKDTKIAFIWFVVLFRQNLAKICKDSPGQRKLFIQSQF